MAQEANFWAAQKKIEDARISGTSELDLRYLALSTLPESLAQLTNLQVLLLDGNHLTSLPNFLRHLTQLKNLSLASNELDSIPDWISDLDAVEYLSLSSNRIADLPKSLGRLTALNELHLGSESGGNPLGTVPACVRELKNLRVLGLTACCLKSLPTWLLDLSKLERLVLAKNPLRAEFAAANKEGLYAIKNYLRAKIHGQVVLNEAKLILVGEGAVGKSCLLDSLCGDDWAENNPTTHGIKIKTFSVDTPGTNTTIKFNGWDFGGQRVSRPTHQLFFSAPAIYLVVWKPREGIEQGHVKEWIKLVKHREPDAKIFVVATHGGATQRQPDIDRQEIWDIFGKDMILGFLVVDNKPDGITGARKGIVELRSAIARAATALPEMGQKVPQRWEVTRQALRKDGAPYMPLHEVLAVCRKQNMDDEEAKDFLRISHRLGHLIYYEHDVALRGIVVLKPDWLSSAISLVLDDKQTRDGHGLIEFSRLQELWNDPTRPIELRYPPQLHSLFLRLMERFDLSYKVAVPSEPDNAIGFWQQAEIFHASPNKNELKLQYTSLIAQLVPDERPSPNPAWFVSAAIGDEQQAQICRIVDSETGDSAPAEGLFFQLIVRLHKYSLGRLDYSQSVHWRRGVVLEDDYGAHALLENVGNDVRITVRSPYPERFLSALTYEIKWLVDNFWAGLRCDVMVPCVEPCGRRAPGTGLFEVNKLINGKGRGHSNYPCSVCNEWQNVELLLRNAPAARPNPLEGLLNNSKEILLALNDVRRRLSGQTLEYMGRFDKLDANHRELVTKVDAAYANLMTALVDEAKDGPRLFSFEPIGHTLFERPNWVAGKFRLTLWCEHSRLPLTALNPVGDTHGVYELSIPREWFVRIAPYLKLLSGLLSLVVPVAASATKLVLDEASYKRIEKQLELGEKSVDSILKGSEEAGSWLGRDDGLSSGFGASVRAQGADLRRLHTWLNEKDPGYGGLLRVQNRRREFLWVHPMFVSEY